MSKKLQLKALIQQYKTSGDEMFNKINEIKKSNNYTDEYKDQLIQAERQKLLTLGQQTKESALEILKDGIKSVSESGRPNISDSNYQLNLANALKLLELGGKNMDKGDIKVLLKPFSGDNLAIAAFKGALINSGMQPIETIDILPADIRGKSIEYLKGISNNIKQYVNPNLEWGGLTGAGMAINGVNCSVDNLDDNLNYVGPAIEAATEI